MIKNILTSESLLSRKCESVDTNMEIVEIDDLIDTAEHHAENNKVGCLGLAANQINILKRIIVVRVGLPNVGLVFIPMVNPEFKPIEKAGMLGGTERCLSRPDMTGIFKNRWKKIEVTYFSAELDEYVTRKFTKLTARVMQHECDHLNGVLI